MFEQGYQFSKFNKNSWQQIDKKLSYRQENHFKLKWHNDNCLGFKWGKMLVLSKEQIKFLNDEFDVSKFDIKKLSREEWMAVSYRKSEPMAPEMFGWFLAAKIR